MLKRAFSGKIEIEWEQEEIIKVLAETLKGVEFYDHF